MKPSVIILTHNSEETIAQTLAAIGDLSDDIHVVDSGSSDRTLELADCFGAKIHYHPFSNYGSQRNWSIDNLTTRYQWQLHLDADEKISEKLKNEIDNLPCDTSADGFFIKRFLRFMGRDLKHNLSPTWHMRLFRNGMGRCEGREYDQHFICRGRTRQLDGSMVDDVRMPLAEWTSRHNRWSDAEAREAIANRTLGRIQPKLTGNIVERKRFLRSVYDRFPPFSRAFLLFGYRYFFKGGFLDGQQGLIFCVLQAFWFRFLVDAKIFEAKRTAEVLGGDVAIAYPWQDAGARSKQDVTISSAETDSHVS